jgi:hypothetical protein
MGFYISSHRQLQTDLLQAYRATAPKIYAPSLQALRMFRLKLNHSSDIPILELCRELLFRSPHFVRIFQAGQLLQRTHNRSTIGHSPSIGLLELRIALDLSWDETRATICSLRSILNGKPQRMDKLLDVIHALCSELSGDTSLARGFLRLIQKIGAYDLPARLL